MSLNQPFYMYQQPMFAITVSMVLVVDNGVLVLKEDDKYKFPGGMVKAGIETVQFAAVRMVKEYVGIALKKETLIPVDFRSDPERSKEGNVVDIGFLCIMEKNSNTKNDIQWIEVDFEKRQAVDKIKFYSDHEILLERAIEIIAMMK